MLRSVRRPAARSSIGAPLSGGLGGGGGKRRRSPWWASVVRSVVGVAPPGTSSSTSVGLVLLAFVAVTGVFFMAIRRHDVNLSFDQRLTLGRHLHTFGNKTVYLAEPSRVDMVLSRLSHDDWTKISSKIDYVAFVYDNVYLPDVFPALAAALETVSPHGYGIALFSCGCLIHNVLLQHVSVRFDGMECAMLPGFVLETAAVRWVEAALDSGACSSRDSILGTQWYSTHSWKLQTAREEYAGIRTHLSLVQHPDRPPEPRQGPTVHAPRPR
jgi:hypothetical protein